MFIVLLLVCYLVTLILEQVFLYNCLLQYFNLIFLDKDWKPKVCYYDFYAQSTEKAPVKQVFPYVKVYVHSIFHYY